MLINNYLLLISVLKKLSTTDISVDEVTTADISVDEVTILLILVLMK